MLPQLDRDLKHPEQEAEMLYTTPWIIARTPGPETLKTISWLGWEIAYTLCQTAAEEMACSSS